MCTLTRQVSVCLIFGSELKNSEQEFLCRAEKQTVLNRREESGGHVTDKGDEWLQVACV